MKLIQVFLMISLSFSSYGKIHIRDGRIYLEDEKAFEEKLELKTFKKAAEQASLRETGFIVSSTQSTFQDQGFSHKWVSLEDEVLKDNKVDLAKMTPLKGLSYGVIATSKDFEADLEKGQSVTVRRYGLPDDKFEGRIEKIIASDKQDIIQVHFTVFKAPELIAGSTCEVEIPHIKKTPFRVSLLALLHLGTEDYIVIKDQDGSFYPKHATIIEQDAKEATILLPLSSLETYVARGSILLKPLLTEILSQKEEVL